MDPKIPAIVWPALTSILFAGSFVAAEVTTADLGPLGVSLLRYAVATAFLGTLVLFRRDPSPVRGPDLARFGLLGLFGIVGYHYFFFSSLRHTAVANTAIINAMSPVVTALVAVGFASDRLTVRNYAGVFIAVGAVLLLLTRGDPRVIAALAFNRGDILMLLAVCNWAVYGVLVRALTRRYAVLTVTFFTTWIGVILLIPLAWVEGLPEVSSVSLASLAAVGYMGLLASGIGYLLYNRSIREIGPTRTASVVYGLVPILVAVAAFVIFREPIPPVMIVSIALLAAGLRMALVSPAGGLDAGNHIQRGDA